jgi:hypothetical protein
VTPKFMLLGFLAAAAVPLLAHHSIKAEFDIDRTVTIQDIVSKVEWMNPHVAIYVDTTGMDGKVTGWKVESLPPNTLQRRGWSRDSFKVGDRLMVVGYPVRNGTRLASAMKIVTTDGKQLDTPVVASVQSWTLVVDERYPK